MISKCIECNKLNIKITDNLTECKICSKKIKGNIKRWNNQNKKETK